MALIGPETKVSHQYTLMPQTQVQTQYRASDDAILGGPVNIYSGPIIHAVNSRTGYKLENWKTIIRNGDNATTPLQGKLQSFQSEPCNCYSEAFEPGKNKYNRYQTHGFNGLYTGYGNVSTFWADYFGEMESAADSLALKFLYQRLRQDQTTFRGGIFIGELREALHMIRHPAETLQRELFKYQRQLAKRRPKINNLKTAKRVLADSWLEFSFGWRPLLADISEGITAYERLRDNSFVKRTFSATGEVEGEYLFGNAPAAAGQIILKTNRVTKTVVQVRYKCGSNRTLEGQQSTQGIANMLGVGWRDFVPTIWELTPWSFLVDYFVNVGEILDAATTITSDLTWVCKTVRKIRSHEINCEVDVAAHKQSAGDLFREVGGDAGWSKESETVIKRSSLSSLPFPSFRFSVPGSPTKWMNMAALAAGFKTLTPYYKLRI